MSVFAQEADSYVPTQAPVEAPIEDPAAQPQYVQYPNQPQYAPAPQNAQAPQYAPAQYGQPNQYPPQQQYAPAQYPAQYPNQYSAQQPYYAPAPYPVAQPQYPLQYYQQVFYDDSVAYYQNKIEIYTQSGNSKRRAGNAMMIGGGIAAAIGGIMMIGALDDTDDDDCRYNDYRCNEDHEGKENIAIAGYLILLGGAAVFTTGIVVKIVGGSKLRKAERFRNSLVQYNYRRQHALQLQIEPLINARKGSYGSRLSLNF